MDEELRKREVAGKRIWVLLSAALLLVGLGLVTLGVSRDSENISQQGDVPQTQKPTPSSVLSIEGQKVYVVRVIDGDTIGTDGGQTIRLIGIDTPETVDPRRPVGCFGKEASDEMKRLVQSREVVLVKDVSETDRFGRLLRYVFVSEDGNQLFVNDHLVRQGFAKASTFPPDVKYVAQFAEAEKEAREKSLGLWQKCL